MFDALKRDSLFSFYININNIILVQFDCISSLKITAHSLKNNLEECINIITRKIS